MLSAEPAAGAPPPAAVEASPLAAPWRGDVGGVGLMAGQEFLARAAGRAATGEEEEERTPSGGLVILDPTGGEELFSGQVCEASAGAEGQPMSSPSAGSARSASPSKRSLNMYGTAEQVKDAVYETVMREQERCASSTCLSPGPRARRSRLLTGSSQRSMMSQRMSARQSKVRDDFFIPILRWYAQTVMRTPWRFVVVYISAVLLLIGVLWKPLTVENSFAAFVKADGDSMRHREAYLAALAERKGLNDERRLKVWYVKKEFTIYYVPKDGVSPFRERVLTDMRDLEVRLRALPDWRSLCEEVVTMTHVRWMCDPGETFAAFAWPSQAKNASAPSHERFQLVFDGSGSELLPLPAALAYMQDNFATGQELSRDPGRYFTKGFSPSAVISGNPSAKQPTALRTRFTFFLTYAPEDATRSQRQKGVEDVEGRWLRFIEEQVYPVVAAASDKYEHTHVYYDGDDLLSFEVSDTLVHDVMWAIGSIVFVTAYMQMYIKSLVVSIGCFFIIFISVPVAYVLTPTASTTIASFLSLFLVTVIDIDVIFVFVDFWDQSAFLDDLDERVAWMVVLAGKSCLATSLTTSFGFFSNLASCLQPLREFGLFMGLSVMAVYVFALLLLPPLILIREQGRRAKAAKAAEIAAAKAAECALHDGATLAVVVPQLPTSPASSTARSEQKAFASAAAAADGSDDHVLQSSEAEAKHLGRIQMVLLCLVEWISRCPCILICLTLATLPCIIYGIVSKVKLDMDVPVIFPDDHNQVVGPAVRDTFASATVLDGEWAPPTQGTVCRGEAPVSDAMQDCAVYWCDGGRDAIPQNLTSGTCWLSRTTIRDGTEKASGYDFEGCSKVVLHGRFAAPLPAEPHAGSGGAVWTTEDWQKLFRLKIAPQVTQAKFLWPGTAAIASTALPPLVLEDWASGTVETSSYFDSSVITVSNVSAVEVLSPAAQDDCEVTTMCFFGGSPSGTTCEMEGWTKLDGLFQLGSVPPLEAPERRRLEDRETEVKLPLGSWVDVTVLWGLRAPRSTPLVGPQEEQWSFDPRFEPQNPWAQRAVYQFCADFPEDLKALRVTCWAESFRDYLIENGRKFPSRKFDDDLIEWYSQASYTYQQAIWMVDRKMSACSVRFDVRLSTSAAAEKTLEYKQSWERALKAQNVEASVTANDAWYTAQIFVQAEAQSAIVGSTTNTVLIECVCGWLGITLFTGDPGLALLVLSLVLLNISGLMFFMVFIMDWSMGPIEIVFLVVFLGYSVTYGLHLSHNYSHAVANDEQLIEAENIARKRYGGTAAGSSGEAAYASHLAADEECITDTRIEVTQSSEAAPLNRFGAKAAAELTPQQLRKARTRLAVLHVGGAILCSTGSTIGSTLFFLLCTMTLFLKLGLIVMTVTILSIFITLVVLPAMLMLIGPSPRPFYLKPVFWLSARMKAVLANLRPATDTEGGEGDMSKID
eukprot:TRINITY_DN41720_c0_g1_i1.p1 TRINITY_DN41720_c0_g1~~TRINITY_DN41720_c0_g1_i1.p1  ORF type:complete len:1441 (+),score=276.85 TRINITY_DN41720_c0_g1_i1:95-4417(+)